MGTLVLHPCEGRCHRLHLRDQLRAVCATVDVGHPKRVEWQAHALLADSLSCTAYSNCPGIQAQDQHSRSEHAA
jgi:hypothetical protein